jgi:hypothetical protein
MIIEIFVRRVALTLVFVAAAAASAVLVQFAFLVA